VILASFTILEYIGPLDDEPRRGIADGLGEDGKGRDG
jgi:hypothetical protein